MTGGAIDNRLGDELKLFERKRGTAAENSLSSWVGRMNWVKKRHGRRGYVWSSLLSAEIAAI